MSYTCNYENADEVTLYLHGCIIGIHNDALVGVVI